MSIASIIVSGTLSTLVLIFSCISLNAAKYYSELDCSHELSLVTRPSIVLRERIPFDTKQSSRINKETK